MISAGTHGSRFAPPAIDVSLAQTMSASTAASLAGLPQGKRPLKPPSKAVCVLSGRNIDAMRLKSVL